MAASDKCNNLHDIEMKLDTYAISEHPIPP